ncbi:MAG: M48 family metallopeptidase [Phycisphaerales bacterium]|nr:M48 family metallopeptidase [Phycisphaerales bacterium]
MAINFFEQQDRARKRTGLLVLCFTIGLILMIGVLYVVAMVIMNAIGSDQESGQIEIEFFNGGVLAGVAALVVLVVGGSSLFKIMELRSGGRVVAEMLGAKLLDPGTREHSERVAINVVEEMAIASGTPVPPLYIVEDPTINAFAAGWSPNDAIVSLNRGTIDKLSRDELQGVVAHEFSHIFNGDMRINIRLIGVIHGLLVLGVTGWICLRFIGPAMLGSGRRSSSKNDSGGGIGLAIIVFGLALMLCGFIGTFFGRLVQAAVSRQREFLADASAVEYTRNPDGIGGALRKIQMGGRLKSDEQHEKTSDINHMLFAKALNSMFSTHPPLPDRISRVEGLSLEQVNQQLQEARTQISTKPPPPPGPVAAADRSQAAKRSTAGDIMGAVILGSVLDDAVGRIGTIDQASLIQSRQILESIPEPLNEAAHSTATARLVIFALLLDEDDSDRAVQWERIREYLKESEIAQLKSLEALADSLDPWARLPLLDICIPALSQLSDSQYKTFRECIDTMIRADGRIDRWEWVVDTVLDRHLEERYHKPGAERKANARLSSCKAAVQTVLGTLACIGTADMELAKASFNQGLSELGWQGEFPDPSTLKISILRKALREVRRVRFTERSSFIKACEACILNDGQTTIEEAETLRAVAESIDCPMPPFLPGSTESS